MSFSERQHEWGTRSRGMWKNCDKLSPTAKANRKAASPVFLSTPFPLPPRSYADGSSWLHTRVAALYFDSKSEAAKKRLQKLKAAEFIDERPRRRYEPSILFLARKGYDVLRDQGVLSEYPYIGQSSLERRSRVSDLTLRHELEVMDVKTAFHSATNGTGTFTIAEFSTWPLLHQFEVFRPGRPGAELVKPDGFFRILEKEAEGGLSEHSFFLEVDRSSEIQDTLVARAGCYLEYYKSGGFAVKHGSPRAAYKKYPFRVLMVFKTAERRNNIAERLLQSDPPIYTHPNNDVIVSPKVCCLYTGSSVVSKNV